MLLYFFNKFTISFDAPSPWGIYFQDSATPLPKWPGKSFMGIKLPNSGNLLKLLVPNNVWKYISGWSNYSGTVISQEMIERKMDNRGSKSNINSNIFVKEQRVDGSCIISRNVMLKCTLMGFEINYQNKILTTLLVNYKKNYSTSSINDSRGGNTNLIIDSNFLTGFAVATQQKVHLF